MGQAKYQRPFTEVFPWEAHLDLPLRWRSKRTIFVNSMSDLFHKDVPLEYIQRVFLVMDRAQQHTFQVLTKRSERLAEVAGNLVWPENVWMGVSVESQEYVHRIHDLVTVPAKVRFLSIEPLIGPVENLPLAGIHWVIVGGESGHKARPMELEWARNIRNQCLAQNVPFFLKQLGGTHGKRGGTEAVLDDKMWRAFPV
jgi:protein gp37